MPRVTFPYRVRPVPQKDNANVAPIDMDSVRDQLYCKGDYIPFILVVCAECSSHLHGS